MLKNPQKFLRSLPNKPGVYQMYDGSDTVLYVGKAKNLKKRVASYFRRALPLKTAAFMGQVAKIEIIITPNERGALLLESNLIKDKKPHYNILFKDDKSFPYLVLSKHDFPRLAIYRGKVNKAHGKFFGPFPDTSAVNFIYDLLQKIFKVRVCKDTVMQRRSRPCLLHQIKLCNAPCVGHIDQDSYALQIKLIEQFLNNQGEYVVKKLTDLMDQAAAKMAYEQAADYRDQIRNIRKVQSQQAIIKASGNYDVLAITGTAENIVINVLFVRNGLVIGNKNYSPRNVGFDSEVSQVLLTFIMQHYLENQKDVLMVPDEILVNWRIPERCELEKLLHEHYGKKIRLVDGGIGMRKQLLAIAEDNANNFLRTQFAPKVSYGRYLLDFKLACGLAQVPKRLECFDISHHRGEAQIGSCVVFDQHGPAKSEYRRYNIIKSNAGDDYGALYEVLTRRYQKISDLPDVIMVDGGIGQLSVAARVLQNLGYLNIALLAIAKGRERQPGREVIYLYGKETPLVVSSKSLAFRLMQQIRDEAHRFAVSGHRKKMVSKRRRSEIDAIPGIGKAKRLLLLKYFGGMVELKGASINDLTKVKGIGQILAKMIYEYLHA